MYVVEGVYKAPDPVSRSKKPPAGVGAHRSGSRGVRIAFLIEYSVVRWGTESAKLCRRLRRGESNGPTATS